MAQRKQPITVEELRRRVGYNLRRIMLEREIDETTLAEMLGLSSRSSAHAASNLRRYLRGEKYPREEMVVKWCEALDVDPEEFLKDGG